jgi:hypothetical protein
VDIISWILFLLPTVTASSHLGMSRHTIQYVLL